MQKVAIIGSRKHPRVNDAYQFVNDLKDKFGWLTIVSGGAIGIDRTAETRAVEVGFEVHSYRPFQLSPDTYAVVKWVLNPLDGNPYTEVLAGEHPTWADYNSAILYRDMLIAEEADRCVAFRFDNSRGTSLTMEFFEGYGKPIHLYDYEEEDNEPLA